MTKAATKKKNQPRARGLTEKEFDALVEDGIDGCPIIVSGSPPTFAAVPPEIAAVLTAVAGIERRLQFLENALVWCGGSSDFAPGGKARKGWLKLCAPLLRGRRS